MPSVDERLAALEARVDAMSDVRNLITELRSDMNARFVDVNGRFSEVRADVSGRLEDMNRRFDDMTRQFTELREDVNGRFVDVNRQFSELRGEMNYRFTAMDQKADRHFTWMVSTQVALLLAVVGGLVGAYYR
jgi:predicted  nucleic acid-binding Zn-ribbon protein